MAELGASPRFIGFWKFKFISRKLKWLRKYHYLLRKWMYKFNKSTSSKLKRIRKQWQLRKQWIKRIEWE